MRNGKIKVIALFIAMLFIAIALAGCAGKKATDKSEEPKDGAAQEKIVVKMVGTLPIQHHLTRALEMYKDTVEKKSGGRVEFQLYPAQQLYNDNDLVNALPKGAVEGAILNSDLWAGLIPSEGILFIPTYYQDREQFYKVFDTEAWQIIKNDFEEKGNTKVLGFVEYGAGGIISKKPVGKLEDFKGLRTRAYGEYIATFLQAMGAAPVVMSSGDMYQALQRGTIDAAMSGSSSFVERKLTEVTNYYLENDLIYSTPFLLGFNLDFWNKLPPDLQNIFEDAALEVQEWSKQYVQEADKKYKEQIKEKGLTVTSVDEQEMARWRGKSAPTLEAVYKKNVGEEKAQKILDIIKKLPAS